MLYFDNAATTLKKPQVMVDAMINALQTFGNSGRGTSETSMSAAKTIMKARIAINQLIHGESSQQVVFTHNATESLNLAIKGILQPGDHVITSVMEHNSVLRPLYELEKQGIELTILPMTQNCYVDSDTVKAAIKNNTKAIILTHGSNVTGNINPLEEISQIIPSKEIIFMVDASQTMGAIPIDVQRMGIDILCFTGHKSLMGPQGTGGLYVRPRIKVRPLKTGGTGMDTFNKEHYPEMPTALEAGTLNSHGIAGLLASIKYIQDISIEQIMQDEKNKTDYLYRKLQNISGLTFYGNFQQDQRCPIISLNLDPLNSAEFSEYLLEVGQVITRSGGHCAPLMHETFETKERGMVRLSLSHFTTFEEIDQVVEIIQSISKKFPKS